MLFGPESSSDDCDYDFALNEQMHFDLLSLLLMMTRVIEMPTFDTFQLQKDKRGGDAGDAHSFSFLSLFYILKSIK